MFSKNGFFMLKALGLTACICILGASISTYISKARTIQSTLTEKAMPAQKQQTMQPNEKKLHVDLITKILVKKTFPIHHVAPTTEAQKNALFATYPAKLDPVPACIENACVHFVGHLHPDVLIVALEAAKNMGITEPIFFYETASVCHAFSGEFNRLGLNLSYMLAFHPDYRDKLWPEVKEKHIDYFFRHLYHELHHIKYKDNSSCVSGVTPEEADALGRHCEMRAELGGLWGAHRFHGRDINMKAFYPEDDGAHPAAEDQLRYNALLSDSVNHDSDEDDHQIIEILSHRYLKEKSPTAIAKLTINMPDDLLIA